MNKQYKKQYNRLQKYYKNKLAKCMNFSLAEGDNCIEYMYTYLRYMRDMCALTEPGELDKNMKLATLCAAVVEYERYITCIDNYYKNIDGKPVQIDATKTKEEVDNAYNDERAVHWNNFFTIMYENIEGWKLNETSI